MRILIQPYYFWDGHYKDYTNSLSDSNTISIISSKNNLKKNFISLKPLFLNYRKNILIFMFSRIFNSLNTIIYLRKYFFNKYIFHFLEFEPISKILFLLINIILRKKIVFTIHATSISKSQNLIPNLIKIIQRCFFILALLISNFSNCKFVVHNKFNIKFLKNFVFRKRIFLIPYPCDIPIAKKKMNKVSKLLVFGQFREDKQILEVIKNYNLSKMKIIFAGKFYDLKLLNYLKKIKNFKIINRFISTSELIKLSSKINYFLIPYGEHYSGSAGPMKVSFSMGCPIITSKNKIFSDYIKDKKLGFFLDKNISNRIENLSKKKYQQLTKKCLSYAKNNNWNNFLKKYSKVYKLLDN